MLTLEQKTQLITVKRGSLATKLPKLSAQRNAALIASLSRKDRGQG